MRDPNASPTAGVDVATPGSVSKSKPQKGPTLLAILVMLAITFSWFGQVMDWYGSRLVEIPVRGGIHYTIPKSNSRFATGLGYLGLGTFIMAGCFAAMRTRHSKVSRAVPIFLTVAISYAGMWVVMGFAPSEYIYAFGFFGPLYFMMCLGVYAGFDESLWRYLRPLVIFLSYYAIFLSVYYTTRLSVTGIIEGDNPMNQNLQTAFWYGIAAYGITEVRDWKTRILAFIPVALCIPVGILIASRSWSLLGVLGVLFILKEVMRDNFRMSTAKSVLLGLIVVLALGVGIWVLSIYMPDRFEQFGGRLTEDTRSSQYSQFFSQVTVPNLVTGLGPKATYTFNDHLDYGYIDNQFLFVLFKFGSPVLIGYFVVIILPGLLWNFRASTSSERFVGIFFVFWTLACLGLATFHGIYLNPQNAMVILMGGRCWRWLSEKGDAYSNRLEWMRATWPRKQMGRSGGTPSNGMAPNLATKLRTDRP